jgi:hypothetical protein
MSNGNVAAASSPTLKAMRCSSMLNNCIEIMPPGRVWSPSYATCTPGIELADVKQCMLLMESNA